MWRSGKLMDPHLQGVRRTNHEQSNGLCERRLGHAHPEIW